MISASILYFLPAVTGKMGEVDVASPAPVLQVIVKPVSVTLETVPLPAVLFQALKSIRLSNVTLSY